MSLDTNDLLEPFGDLTAGMFPDDDASALTARLDEYLTRATAIATPNVSADDLDNAVRAYVYYTAFNAAANILAAKPANASLQGLGSVGYSSAQFQYFAERSRLALAAYEGYRVTATTLVVSAAAQTRFTW